MCFPTEHRNTNMDSHTDLFDPSTKKPLSRTQKRKKQKKAREVIWNMKMLALSSPHNISNGFPGLFRPFASTNVVLLKNPKESKSTPLAIRSCLNNHYGILAGQSSDLKLIKVERFYQVSSSKCILTNCVDPNSI